MIELAARFRQHRRLAAAGLCGTGLLAMSFSAEAGSPEFYLLTSALASTWTAGAVGSGPVPAGGTPGRGRLGALAEPVLAGAATFGLFYAAARIARRSPVLNRAVSSVFHYVHEGSVPLVLLSACVNAVAEELYFRGAVWKLTEGSRPLAATTLVYTAATGSTRNIALVLGGAATSVVFGAERARSGGVVAPAVAHVTWSVLMLTFLPPLFRNGAVAAGQQARPARLIRSYAWPRPRSARSRRRSRRPRAGPAQRLPDRPSGPAPRTRP